VDIRSRVYDPSVDVWWIGYIIGGESLIRTSHTVVLIIATRLGIKGNRRCDWLRCRLRALPFHSSLKLLCNSWILLGFLKLGFDLRVWCLSCWTNCRVDVGTL
jgi:hypothetical protein